MSSKKRFLTYALGTLVIGATLVLTPPVGAENSTTIDSSTQPNLKSWSNIIPHSNRRFVVLADFSNQAVLDRETGLVWEKAPDASPAADWVGAKANCLDKSLAGRKGWRLPAVVELSSLVDTTQRDPTLPVGHPFVNVQLANYWSATTLADNSTIAWAVHFSFGGVGVVVNKSGGGLYGWCVRGPMNTDTY
jgi:hypothetical protein